MAVPLQHGRQVWQKLGYNSYVILKMDKTLSDSLELRVVLVPVARHDAQVGRRLHLGNLA